MKGAPPRTVPIVAQKGRNVNASLGRVCAPAAVPVTPDNGRHQPRAAVPWYNHPFTNRTGGVETCPEKKDTCPRQIQASREASPSPQMRCAASRRAPRRRGYRAWRTTSPPPSFPRKRLRTRRQNPWTPACACLGRQAGVTVLFAPPQEISHRPAHPSRVACFLHRGECMV